MNITSSLLILESYSPEFEVSSGRGPGPYSLEVEDGGLDAIGHEHS